MSTRASYRLALLCACAVLCGCGTTRPKTVTSTKTVTSGPAPTGTVDIFSEGGKRAFFIAADNLPPSKGFFYVVWLYNSPTSRQALSRSPRFEGLERVAALSPLGSSRRLQGGAPLPANARQYHQMLMTRETTTRPTIPGPVVLHGPFTLGSPPPETSTSHEPVTEARLTLSPPGG